MSAPFTEVADGRYRNQVEHSYAVAEQKHTHRRNKNMLPLRDNIPSESPPFVNYLIIGLCTVVFLFQVAEERGEKAEMVEKYGMIPHRVRHPSQPVEIVVAESVRTDRGQAERQVRTHVAAPTPFPAWLTLLTCCFLHGGWMHFLGNMWFLYIFGDNVEDRFGHFVYLLLYLGWGIAASLTHLLTNSGSSVPTIGASGAIAGVMGAYMWLYPHGRVMTLIPFGIFSRVMEIPAVMFLGIWFVLQVLSGTISSEGVQSGGVAWWAHIGGFAAGFAAAILLGGIGGRSQKNVAPPDSDQVMYEPPSRHF